MYVLEKYNFVPHHVVQISSPIRPPRAPTKNKHYCVANTTASERVRFKTRANHTARYRTIPYLTGEVVHGLLLDAQQRLRLLEGLRLVQEVGGRLSQPCQFFLEPVRASAVVGRGSRGFAGVMVRLGR